MILPSQNQRLAEKYFKSLSSDDESVQYYNGLKYENPNMSQRFYNMFFKNEKRLNSLFQFYPYQNTILATHEEYFDRKQSGRNIGLIFSFSACSFLFTSAKQGYILPLLNQYGKYFKTHRILRHYGWAIVLPQLFYECWIPWVFSNHIEHCWIVHSKRMNQKILEDPQWSIYPSNFSLPLKNY